MLFQESHEKREAGPRLCNVALNSAPGTTQCFPCLDRRRLLFTPLNLHTKASSLIHEPLFKGEYALNRRGTCSTAYKKKHYN